MTRLSESQCVDLSQTEAGQAALRVIEALEERVSFAEEARVKAEQKLEADTAEIREKNKRMGAALGKITATMRAFYAQKKSMKDVFIVLSELLKAQDPKEGPFPQTMVFPASPPGASLRELLEQRHNVQPFFVTHQLKTYLGLRFEEDRYVDALLNGTAEFTDELLERLAKRIPDFNVEFWKRRQQHYTEALAVHGRKKEA